MLKTLMTNSNYLFYTIINGAINPELKKEYQTWGFKKLHPESKGKVLPQAFKLNWVFWLLGINKIKKRQAVPMVPKLVDVWKSLFFHAF